MKLLLLISIVMLFSWGGCYLILRTAPKHAQWTLGPRQSIQTSHDRPAARIGGSSVFVALGLGLGLVYLFRPHYIFKILALLFIAGIPVFVGGLWEDLTGKIPPYTRLILAFLGALGAALMTGLWVQRLNIPYVDLWMALGPIGIIVTAFAVSGLVHAVNIIDGVHGLSSGVTMIMLAGLGLVAWRIQDAIVLYGAGLGIGAVAGFFLWNYPKGRLFWGDGGAYFMGFWTAQLCVILLARNYIVSAWLCLLVVIYPVTETVFSVVRRVYGRRSAFLPDRGHLHSLLFDVLTHKGKQQHEHLEHVPSRASVLTAAILWILNVVACIPGLVVWRNSAILGSCVFLFVMLYLGLYTFLNRKR